MCEPITLAIVGASLAAGGAVLGEKQKYDSDKAQIKAQERQAQANVASLIANYQGQRAELRQRTQEAYEQALARRQQALREQAMVKTASVEAGVAGSSAVDRLMITSQIQYGMDRGNIQEGLENAQGAFAFNMNNLYKQVQMENIGLSKFRGQYNPWLAPLNVLMGTASGAMSGMSAGGALQGLSGGGAPNATTQAALGAGGRPVSAAPRPYMSPTNMTRLQ